LLRAKQGRAALRAVELDPSLAIAQRATRQYYWEAGDEELSLKHFDRAVELDPMNRWCSDTRQAMHGIRRFRHRNHVSAARALRDPMNSVVRQNLGVLLAADGRWMRRLRLIVPWWKSSDLDPEIMSDIPRLLVLLGRDNEAVSEASRLPAGELRDHVLAFLYRNGAHRKERMQPCVGSRHTSRLRARFAGYQMIDSIRLAENYAFAGLTRKRSTPWRKSARVMSHREAHQFVRKFRAELRLAIFLRPLRADPRWQRSSLSPLSQFPTGVHPDAPGECVLQR
jgi:hypothetical protein